MKLRWSALALATLLSACGTNTTGDGGIDDPEANPQDHPTYEVSDACGGKCDDPNAAINTSRSRILASLDMVEYIVEEAGVTELATFAGGVLAIDDELAPEIGATLDIVLYAIDDEANETKLSSQLVFDGEAFVTEPINLAELGAWQLLRIDVTGLHAERDILQGFEYAEGFTVGDEVIVETEDPFAAAYDVSLPVIYIDPSVPVPDYERPQGVDGFSLGGTEFWQRWSGGHSPTFSYSAGTELGRKCMYASARRFEAIMQEAPESMVNLKATTGWSGSFFNWNDDFSDEAAYQRPRGAVLWAWRTSLVKWISQTGADGSCFLPTLEQVERAAADCQSTGDSNDGAIEGCQAY